MPSTMALRFRDLVLPTIDKHNELIGANHFVWWGWWNKPNEKIPRNVFAAFKQTILESGQLTLFFVDSGKEKLYQAVISEIVESPTEIPISCPDATKTPDYYSTASYKAWFKIKQTIAEINPDAIRDWSYDEIDEFLDDPASPRFQSKRVFSIQADPGVMKAPLGTLHVVTSSHITLTFIITCRRYRVV